MTNLADELRRLARKYQWMRSIRAATRAPATMTSKPSPSELRRFAHEFPGVLAELDRLGDEVLGERCKVLEALVVDGRFAAMEMDTSMAMTPEELPPWVRGWLYAHTALRGALACKRWLAGVRIIDHAVQLRLLAELDTLPFPAEARLWVERLSEVADPPRGRLLDVVLEDVARRLSIDPHGVRDLLMPRPS